ncbi:hypothetical protein [Periweissella fabalis]|uniref:Uncharacterized protein n=1 Tax=Periweissella fabalis TaxID=1070421 RepID=A0A7X6N578_9LACO|nr:hypothetical protein [Periweissella fabalis]MCM0598560.1 hypothetical protein [Periweissella fabalis]NKZ24158.1 hypothetical protein [Periweissella fabalis]
MSKLKISFSYLLFLLVSFITVFVLAHHGTMFIGDDSSFIFSRILEFNADFSQHNNPSNLYSFNTFGNIGSAVQNFYPNKILYIFLFFNFFTHNLITSYYVGIFFILFVGFLIAYHSFLAFNNYKGQAIIFALAFGLSNYQLSNIVTRFDIGEWTAIFLMPLILVGFYKIMKFNSIQGMFMLALGLAGVLAVHVLSVLLITLILALIWIAVICISQQQIVVKTWKIFCAYLIMLILNMPFIINLFKLHQLIHQPTVEKLPFNNVISYAQLITNSLANQIALSLGIFFIFVFIYGILNFNKFAPIYKFIFIITISISMLATNIFPWAIFNNSFIKVIQFPWRFIGLNSIFVALLLAYIYGHLVNLIHKKLKINYFIPLCVAIASILAVQLSTYANIVTIYRSSAVSLVVPTKETVAAMITHHAQRPKGTQIYNYDSLEAMANTVNLTYKTTDYWPQKSVPFMQSILMQQVLSPNNQAHLVGQPKQRNNVVTINVVSQKVHVNLDLPILNYANQYTMFVNGKKTSYTVSKRGTLEFNTPAKQIQIKLLPKLTPLYHNLNLISNILWIAIILGLVINMLFKRFKPQFAFD